MPSSFITAYSDNRVYITPNKSLGTRSTGAVLMSPLQRIAANWNLLPDSIMKYPYFLSLGRVLRLRRQVPEPLQHYTRRETQESFTCR